jgi:hypothetical protein
VDLVHDTPWELNDQDYRFYKERYSQSMQKEWVEKSGLTQVTQATGQTLKVNAILVEPLLSGTTTAERSRAL